MPPTENTTSPVRQTMTSSTDHAASPAEHATLPTAPTIPLTGAMTSPSDRTEIRISIGEFGSADISISIDGHHLTASVDTGEDYSVISQTLAERLRKAKTPWLGLQNISAGEHLMTPVGKCTARIGIGDSEFVVSFVCLPACCKDLILGMNFLSEHNAVIDGWECFIRFAARNRRPENAVRRPPLRVIDDDVNVPPRSCRIVSVMRDVRCTVDGITERMHDLLLNHDIAVARSMLHFTEGRAELLLTNFGKERRHFAKGATVAYFGEIAGNDFCIRRH